MPHLIRMQRFITVEGCDGSGKTTAIATIKACIEAAGHEVVVTREPGGTPLAEQIRQLLLPCVDVEAPVAETELLLMFAARTQHLQQVILPALLRGAVVLCDRFTDSSYAYQGGGRGIDAHVIAKLEAEFVGFRPIATLLLDTPTHIALSRSRARNGDADRIEQESHDFFDRVRNVFLARAAGDPKRFSVIDSSKPLEDVQGQIQAVVASNLDGWIAD